MDDGRHSKVIARKAILVSQEMTEREATGQIARQTAVETSCEQVFALAVEADDILHRDGISLRIDLLRILHLELACRGIDSDDIIERQYIVTGNDVDNLCIFRFDNGIQRRWR